MKVKYFKGSPPGQPEISHLLPPKFFIYKIKGRNLYYYNHYTSKWDVSAYIVEDIGDFVSYKPLTKEELFLELL